MFIHIEKVGVLFRFLNSSLTGEYFFGFVLVYMYVCLGG